MLIAILLALNIAVCICLVAVVLLQRSEGGALGMGGGPSGFMTARGAGNLLTTLTWWLAGAFFVISLALTLLSGKERGGSSVVDRVKVESIDPDALNKQAPATAPGPAPAQPAPLEAPTPTIRNPFGIEPQNETTPAP